MNITSEVLGYFLKELQEFVYTSAARTAGHRHFISCHFSVCNKQKESGPAPQAAIYFHWQVELNLMSEDLSSFKGRLGAGRIHPKVMHITTTGTNEQILRERNTLRNCYLRLNHPEACLAATPCLKWCQCQIQWTAVHESSRTHHVREVSRAKPRSQIEKPSGWKKVSSVSKAASSHVAFCQTLPARPWQ